MKIIGGKEYLTVSEMSNALDICDTTLNNWIRKDLITPAYISPSGRKFFTQEQLDFCLNNRGE